MEITKSDAPKLFPELRAWMERTNTTQGDLARILGIKEPQMSRMLSGQRGMSPDYSVKLASLTGIPVEKLLGDRAAMRLLKFLGKHSKVSSEKTKGKRNVA